MINLKKCSKKELENSINYMLKNASHNLYILLEDEYTENPTIIYTSDRNKQYNAFAEINAGYYGKDENDNYINELMEFEGHEQNIVTVSDFVNSLYDFIVKEYR